MRPQSISRLVPLVNSLLIILIAYSLAQITWRFFGADPTVSNLTHQPVAQLSTATLPDADTADASIIANWHLFGKLNDRPATVVVKKVPETRLNLRLVGIFYSESNNLQPMALIAEGTQAERSFNVGDFLTDSVRVHEILTDRVILSRAGRLETLKLPKQTAASSASSANSNRLARAATSHRADPATGANNEIKAGAIAQQLRQSASDDLSGLQQLAYTRPYVQNGQFMGFQLQPGRNRRLLRQIGLRNGDVITEVNGIKLYDPGQGMQVIQELMSAERIDAKVLRNGNEIPFTFLLNQQ